MGLGSHDRLHQKIFVRISHLVITLGVVSSLVFQESDLHEAIWGADLMYCVPYLSLTLLSVSMYLVACFMDPGYVSITDKKPAWQKDSESEDDLSDKEDVLYEHKVNGSATSDNLNHKADNIDNRGALASELEMRDTHHTEISLADSDSECSTDEKTAMLNSNRHGSRVNGRSSSSGTSPNTIASGRKRRKCGFCGIQQPLRARHCEDCNRCVLKFDHHCPWLETCVGEHNHKYFWLFLLSTMALIIWSGHIIARAYRFGLEWDQWFWVNGFFMVDFLAIFAGGFVVLTLTGLHTYLAFTNQSTWELVSRHRITYLKHIDSSTNPFHEGYICNIWRFLCNCRQRHWDTVYNKIVPTLHTDDQSQL